MQNQPAPNTTDSEKPQHPGIYLQDLLKKQHMNGKTLALRTGTSSAHISNVLNAKKPLSLELARDISFVLGIDFQELITRQSHYEKWCLVESEKQQITAEELALAARLIEEASMIKSGKESTAKLNDQERVIALRKYFKIDNLLRVPAVLQTLIDPPLEILEEKPYQALAMLNKFDAAAAEYKKREDFTAGPLNQDRLKEILPALSAVKEAGKSIKQVLKALEQRGIIIRFTTRSKNSLFYAYIRKVQPGTLLVFITERYDSDEALWALLEDLLNKVMLGEVNNRLVYFQLPAPPAPLAPAVPAQPGSTAERQAARQSPAQQQGGLINRHVWLSWRIL